MLRTYLAYVQIKDARLDTGEVVTSGAGDGELVEIIRELHADGFDGFFSLEPHLGQAHALGGFSGPESLAGLHRYLEGRGDRLLLMARGG